MTLVDRINDLSNRIATEIKTLRALRVPVPASGFYSIPISSGGFSNSTTLGVGTLRVLPWFVTRPIIISRVGGEIISVGDTGSKLRIGIYADNGYAYPGNLLRDFGQIATDVIGTPEIILGTSETLQIGLYWLGGVIQSVTTNQPNIRTNSSTWTPPVTGLSQTIPFAGQATLGYLQNSVTGALPISFTTTPNTAGSGPRLFIKQG